MSSLVSIITPTFNSAKYIVETIRSVQNQTYQNWELLIVDDGSTDESVNIVSKLALNDPRIKMFKLHKNEGAGKARDYALNKATGNYIAFLDSDDLWKNDKLEKQLNFLSENKLPITFSFYELINENGEPLKKMVKTPKKIYYPMLFYCNWIGNLTGIYAVDYFGKVPISSIRKRQDWVLWLTIVKKIKYVEPVPESLAFYRVRETSVSSSKVRLIKYNYNVYKHFHKGSIVMSYLNTFIFLMHQIFIKRFFTKKIV